MVFRLIIAFAVTLCFGAKASACSCYGWEGGYVSDFSKQYLSAWVVPLSAKLETQKTERGFDAVVKYELEILDSFNAVMQTSMVAYASVEDGASCGEQLIVGTPQFLTFGRTSWDGTFTTNCAPELPYAAIKAYLKNGLDSYVPSLNKCFDENAELVKSKPECKVWEESASSWRRYGDEDYLKYVLLWGADQKSRAQNSTP